MELLQLALIVLAAWTLSRVSVALVVSALNVAPWIVVYHILLHPECLQQVVPLWEYILAKVSVL
jgi:hypothetical protein